MMFWNTKDKELQKKINTNKHGIAKLLKCYDRNGPSPSAFEFKDEIIESTPENCVAILGMKRTPIAATIKKVMGIKEPTTVDDEELVCLIGFYMCC
ncbi:hypothetical protein MKX01_011311, partial [Papaver californicum]